MARLRPAAVRAPSTAADDPRVGHLLGRALRDPAEVPRAALVGFPSDEGIRRNGGRIGAATAPGAIRDALHRLTPDAGSPDPFIELLERTADLGDVEVSGDVESDQAVLADAVAPHLARGTFVIVLGGGHETSFGHFLAYAHRDVPVEILNWDAHPDVRPLRDGRAHSGSPFRQALEHSSECCRRYTAAALLPHATASAHLEWLRERGGRAVWRDDVTRERIARLYDELAAPSLVSFDLDAVDRAFAPGVSAPATGGMTPGDWLYAAELAGRTPAVASIDVVELSPPHDRDGQTAALAAATVWRTLRGLSARPRPSGSSGAR